MATEDSSSDLSRFREWKFGFDARLEETKKPGFDKGKIKDGSTERQRKAWRSRDPGPSTSERNRPAELFLEADSVATATPSSTTNNLEGGYASNERNAGSQVNEQVITSEGSSVLTIQLVEPDPVSVFRAMRVAYSNLVSNIFDRCTYLHFPIVEEMIETLKQYKKQIKDAYEQQYGAQLISEAWDDFSYWIFVQENRLLGQNIERQAKATAVYQFLKKSVIDFGERLNLRNISEYGSTRDVLQELMSRNVIKNQITELFGDEWIKVYQCRRLEICASVQQCIRLVQQYKKKVESMFDANQLPTVASEELKRTAEDDLEVIEAALGKVPGTDIFVHFFENLANEIYRSSTSKAETENRNWNQAIQYAKECYVNIMIESLGERDITENALIKQHEEVRAKVCWAFDNVEDFLYSKLWTMDGVSDDSLICEFKKAKEVRAAEKRAHQLDSSENVSESAAPDDLSAVDEGETAPVTEEDQKSDDEEARLVEMWNIVAEEAKSKPTYELFQNPVLTDSATTLELVEETKDDHADNSDSDDDGVDAADVLSNIEYDSCESDVDSTSAAEPESTSEGTHKDSTAAAEKVQSLETISSQESSSAANLDPVDSDIEDGEIMSPIRGPSSERNLQSPRMQEVAMSRDWLPQNKKRSDTTSRENKPESSRRKRALSPIRPPSPGPELSPILSESSIFDTEVLEDTSTSKTAISLIITSSGIYFTCCREGETPHKIIAPKTFYVVKSDDGLPQLSEEPSLAAELLDVYDLLMERDKIRLCSTQYMIGGKGHFLYTEELLALYFTKIKSQISTLYSLQFLREWIAIAVPVTMPSAGRTRLKTALELAGMPNTVIVQTTTALVLNEPEKLYTGRLFLAIVVLEDSIEVAVIEKAGESFVTRAVKASPGPTNLAFLDRVPLIQRIYANMVQACEDADINLDHVNKCFLTINSRISPGQLSPIWNGLRSMSPRLHIRVHPSMPAIVGAGLRLISMWKMNPTEDLDYLYKEVFPWTLEIDHGPGVSNYKLIHANNPAELRSTSVILKRLQPGCQLKIIRSMWCIASFDSVGRISEQELEFDAGTWKMKYPSASVNVIVDSQGHISLELVGVNVKAQDISMEFNYMPLDRKTVKDATRRFQMMISRIEQRPATSKPIVQTVKRIKLHVDD